MTAPWHRSGDGGLAAQRTAADPTASVWVAANAGSGKTRVLVDRVIRLMLAGTPPARILCLTFTRAAAAEMANRLFERLGEWTAFADDDLAKTLWELTGNKAVPDDLARARRLFARAVDAPGGLKIQTIHAFCESLLGRFPLEAGVPPHAAVMDERTAAEVMREARDDVLIEAQKAPDCALAGALNHVVARVGEDAFHELMAELAKHRGRLRQALDTAGGEAGLLAATRRRLGLVGDETAEGVIAAACAEAAFDGPGLRRAVTALETGSAADKDRARAIAAWLVDAGARPLGLQSPAGLQGAYGNVFLTKPGEARAEGRLITKKAQAADGEALAVLVAEQQRLLAVNARLKAVRVAEATAALLRLGTALIDAFEARKAAAARLDYDDLILKARDLLRGVGAAWVLYKLDGGLDHILVDEAQDTSPEQWQVIAALSEEFFAGLGTERERALPRSVFAVGDEKQSIFSFQGADPAAFERMREHFGKRVSAAKQRWLSVPLAMSFRAAPVILKGVDAVFADAETRAGVTAAEAKIAHIAFRRGHGGLVELWPPVKPADAPEPAPWDAPLDQLPVHSPAAVLAERIAKTIRCWLDKGEVLASRGRPVRPGDIMILVRRRGPFFDEMVRCLKADGVPVAGADRMVLAEQLAVMDLTALAEFLLLPEDDLTLAAVLKGPLFGFDDDDLFALAHGRKGTLWSALGEKRTERAVFQTADDELRDLLAHVDYVAPFAFFADLLGRRRGRARITARLGPEANDPLDELLALALEYGHRHAPSMQGFLHWLGAARTEIKRDLEQGRDEVRVMTVHGAKGLESEIVFLPDTCAAPDHSHDDKLLWVAGEGGLQLVLWPVRKDNVEAVCTAAREAARNARLEEYRRLLYVAMTRARDRLYVCGWETSKGRAKGCWYDLMAGALRPQASEVPLWFGETGWRLTSPQEVPPEDKPRPTEGAAGPLPAWATAPASAEPQPPRPLAPSRPEAEPAAISPLVGAGGGTGGGTGGEGLARGRLVHRLLEVLPALAPPDRAAAAREFLARPVHRLDAATREEIARETLAVLEAPAFAGLFGPDSRAEVPLAGVVGKVVVSGQVDRLRVGPQAVEIIDYKTNRPVPAGPDEVPAAYLRQMAAYRALLARIYPGREIRCALLWTAGPRLMALEAALLDPHAP